MSKPLQLSKMFFVWFTFSFLWAIFRQFSFNELISELIAKPIIWLGPIIIFFKLGITPNSVIKDFQTRFLTTRPFWKIFLLPLFFAIFYFPLTNFRNIHIPEFVLSSLLLTVIINFSTAIVEEIVYRGVIFTWTLSIVGSIKAMVFTQILFLLGHIPILIINHQNFASTLSHAFFIVLLGLIETIFYYHNKSIYSAIIMHGVWNSLVYYFVL